MMLTSTSTSPALVLPGEPLDQGVRGDLAAGTRIPDGFQRVHLRP